MFLYSYDLSRTAVLERVGSTTTHLVWPPGKDTTHSVSAATDDSIFFMLCTPVYTIHHYMFVCACPKMSESLARNICHSILSYLSFLFLVPQLAVNNVDQQHERAVSINTRKSSRVCRHRRTGRISSSSVFLRLEARQHGSIRSILS